MLVRLTAFKLIAFRVSKYVDIFVTVKISIRRKTRLTYCKRFNTENDRFERKDNNCNIVLKSPEATIAKKEQNVINVAIWKLVYYKTSAAIYNKGYKALLVRWNNTCSLRNIMFKNKVKAFVIEYVR